MHRVEKTFDIDTLSHKSFVEDLQQNTRKNCYCYPYLNIFLKKNEMSRILPYSVHREIFGLSALIDALSFVRVLDTG